MKITYLMGAVLAALAIGCVAAMAASPDLVTSALHLATLPDAVMAMSLLPMSGHHALQDPKNVALVAARPRGLIMRPRMDAGDAGKILAELQKTFNDFKNANDERIKGVEKNCRRRSTRSTPGWKR
jgi:hypothetical protein